MNDSQPSTSVAEVYKPAADVIPAVLDQLQLTDKERSNAESRLRMIEGTLWVADNNHCVPATLERWKHPNHAPKADTPLSYDNLRYVLANAIEAANPQIGQTL